MIRGLVLALTLVTSAWASHVTVTVTPGSATVASGSTQQFTANTNVTWSTTTGTITSGGLFTAPSVSANTAVTVTARTVKVPRSSGTAQVTVTPPPPPPPPTQHTVDLSWTLSVTPDVTSYTVYRRVLGGSYALLASGVLGTSWRDATVSSGQTYQYVATAFDPDGDGESIYSNMVTAVIP